MEEYFELGTEVRKSRTLEIKGFQKSTPEQDIIDTLSTTELPSALDFSARLAKRSKIYVTYNDVNVATSMIHKLHQLNYKGSILSARYELGFDKGGRRYVDRSSHNTLIRAVQSEAGVNKKPRTGYTYSFNSVTLDNTELPFPSGLYLSRLLSLSRTLSPNDPLLDLLTNPRNCAANKHPKEVSEAMAMVDCVERSVKRVYGVSPEQLTRCSVRVFVVGDGKVPMCCACMCLHFPPQWQYHSIDPLLEALPEQRLGSYASRFFQFRGCSQDFVIPPHSSLGSSNTSSTDPIVGHTGDLIIGNSIRALSSSPTQHPGERSTAAEPPGTATGSSTTCQDLPRREPAPEPGQCLNIVVACHSHAPLREFWSRVSSPKLAVVMPCCANYSDLPGETPLLTFEDFEVYSPKRLVSVYHKG